ncbi:MBL fold metallo-hydrolase [Paenibacillus sp. GCM10027627]|uniref:MBL fold metallo-hydrolase n=1 Tax=unclassified Paenibacillus TaxID=185978 RepID=UPI0036292A81
MAEESEVQAKAMDAAQLAGYVVSGKELVILDVRNEEDFANWTIEGRGVRSVNIPYFELLEGVEEAIRQLPRDKEVLVVCAKEGSSIFVADQLVEAGMADVRYLKGGMKAWSEHVEPVKIGDLEGGGSLYQFVRLGKGCLSYMAISDGEAAVIDAIRTTDVYERFAAEQGAVIKHTIDTHLHADHISGGRKLAEKTGAVYWLPPKDAGGVAFIYEKLEEGAVIPIGGSKSELRALYSPGHTIGSTSILIDGRYLLTGDILFVSSIGRPDLAGQAEDWAGDLRTTLYERYPLLSKRLVVLPAHYSGIEELGEDGRVAAELGELFASNPGLKLDSPAAFRRTVTEQLPPQPNSFTAIRETNMGKLQPSLEEQSEMELGPNRCAVHGN